MGREGRGEDEEGAGGGWQLGGERKFVRHVTQGTYI